MLTSEPAASGDREPVKVCNACGQEKPLTDYFGPYTDARTGQQKWKSPCKACQSKRKAGRPKGPGKYELARERRLRDYPGSKICADCREEKPLADFGQPRQNDRAAGRVALVFRAWCLPCQSSATTARQGRKSGAAP